MGTTDPQPITTQANAICKHIKQIYPDSIKAMAAGIALDEERELEYVEHLADQITDHPKYPDYVLFGDALDGWILEVNAEVRAHENSNK